MAKLTKLAAEQKAAMPVHARAWIDRALAVRPADRERAERGIRAYYRIAGLPEPQRIVWTTSPLVVALAGPIASLLMVLRKRPGPLTQAVRDAVGGAVGDAVRDAVGGAVGGAVHDAVRDAVGGAVRGAVRDAVGDAVGGAVRDAVGDAVGGAVGGGSPAADVKAILELIQRAWYLIVGGAAWAAWPVAYATFYRDHAGLDIARDALRAAEDATEPWWWWPHRDFVIVSERPTRLSRDDAGRLHGEHGPAIQFADGWGLYMWHGRRVPAEWIEHRDQLDPRLALSHPNAEQRRCAAEIVGWARVLEQLDAREIDRDPDPRIGTLLEVELEGNRERFVKVTCGTGRLFCMPVPPEMRTALEAQAWMYDGIDAELIRVMQGRT